MFQLTKEEWNSFTKSIRTVTSEEAEEDSFSKCELNPLITHRPSSVILTAQS